VLVAGEAVAGADERDLAVGAVQDHVIASAATELRVSLPPGQYGAAPITLYPEIGHPEPDRLEPDGAAAFVDDQWAALAHGLLWRDEDVTWCRAVRGDVDRHRRRPEVWP